MCYSIKYIQFRKNVNLMGLFSDILLAVDSPMYYSRFDMCHTGVTVIEFPSKTGPVMPTVLTLSNDSHLYRDGLPTNYQHRILF